MYGKSNKNKVWSLKQKFISILISVALWQIVALWLNQPALLASPIDVIKTLFDIIFKKEFWATVIFSFSKISVGFLLAIIIGTLLASLSYKFDKLELLLYPFMSVVKAVPVVSFIILCFIWIKAENLSVLISFLMVLPIVYTGILNGIKSTDIKLLEMAKVFKINNFNKIKYIYLPSLKPQILSICSVSVGFAWKSGVAAEVITIPNGSIGDMLYKAKIYLNSNELLAWTVVIVIISMLFEKIISKFIKFLYQRYEGQ